MVNITFIAIIERATTFVENVSVRAMRILITMTQINEVIMDKDVILIYSLKVFFH
jgi:hypothetical protein